MLQRPIISAHFSTSWQLTQHAHDILILIIILTVIFILSFSNGRQIIAIPAHSLNASLTVSPSHPLTDIQPSHPPLPYPSLSTCPSTSLLHIPCHFHTHPSRQTHFESSNDLHSTSSLTALDPLQTHFPIQLHQPAISLPHNNPHSRKSFPSQIHPQASTSAHLPLLPAPSLPHFPFLLYSTINVSLFPAPT
jgi:hypothetical protein